MKKITLDRYIDKKIKKNFIIILLILLISSGIIYNIAYRKIYLREKEILSTNLNYYFADTDNILGKIEDTYYNEMKDSLIYLYNNIPEKNRADFLNNEIGKLKNKLLKSRNNNLYKNDFNINKVNYYLIDKNGEIVLTNYPADKGLNLSQYQLLWEKINNLHKKEIKLLPFAKDISGDLRIYAYVRLKDNSFLELGISFNNLQKLLVKKIDKLNSKNYMDVQLFTYAFEPLIENNYENISNEEIVIFQKSIESGNMIEKDITFFKKAYYKSWDSTYGDRFIRVNVNYSTMFTVFIVITSAIIILTLILLIFRNNLKKEIHTITENISSISHDMDRFSKTRNSHLDIKNNNIIEINNIYSSYTEMAKELVANYEQLEAYNSIISATNNELKQSYIRANNLSQNLEKIISITCNLSNSSIEDVEEFFADLLHVAILLIPESDYGSIHLYEDEKVNFIETVGFNKSILNKLEIPDNIFISEFNGVNIEKNSINNIYKKLNKNKKELYLKATKPVKETLSSDLIIDNSSVAGICMHISIENEKKFTQESIKILEAIKNLATAFYTFQSYNKIQGKITKEIILSITKMLEIHDKYTSGHSQNVANLSLKIAKEMNLSFKDIYKTYWAGLVHDIGKVLIPDNILNKKGKLTSEEYETVKKHPYWGYKVLSESKELKDIANYVLYHHERWDGKGYTKGLKNNEIPLISQILTLADAWDAMRSNRAYRNALSPKEAINEIKRNRGSQFSPEVVDVFINKVYNTT